MSTWTSIREAIKESAVNYAADKAGIQLTPPVTDRAAVPTSQGSALAQASAWSTKYRVALILAAGLGALLLIRMRK